MTTETTPELEGIAIVGLAAHVPGSRTIAEFWKNLHDGVESISFFSEEELIASGIDPSLVRAPNYIKACGVLGDTDQFDAAFFGLNPREAALMDPQHRVFLQCAWEAMETAGYSPERQPGRTGVFGGMSMNTYLLTNVYPHLSHVASVESLQASIGNDKDALTTEVAYRLNLKGPAVTIQSSSSTSLTAIHYACQSLLSYECDMALAGGVSIHFPEKQGYLFYEGGTTSSDGHCRPFDSRAEGFVSGHGAGVVALRRLADAIAAGDTIYAVVKATAVNNDGSQKVSYMAPSVEGQAEVVSLAQALAGVEPDSIGYVECHGTATQMGDPIEIAALTQAFRAGTDRKGFCAIGSAKSNIGHLDSAAGAVGLIKAALVLHHKQIPATLHFESPNPAIDFDNSPFYVNAKLSDWPEGETPRRAGVTSLGMGGTNAHAILEETPALPASDKPRRPAQVLMLSARSDASLEAATDRLVSHLRANPELNLADAAFTLQMGRKRFARRRIVVAHTLADAAEALASREPARVFTGGHETEGRPVMFMFSGQGSQYVDMGRHLYESEPLFRGEVDACAKKLEKHLGFDLRTVLYPSEAQREAATERLKQTSLTQPALFVIEYALAKLWMSWGLKPQAMIGHSIGEYVAACLAGVFSLEDALALVAARGRLMQQMPAGAMLALPMTEAQVLPLLGAELSLAAVNSPETCVVAGPIPAIDALAEKLTAQGVSTNRLHTSHAFHSSMMDPILDAFREQVRRVSRQVPQLPYLSNVTGKWITAEEATSPDYWAKHLRQAVRFADGLSELLKEADAVLLEVGPGQTLATLARQHPAKGAQHVFINSLRHPREQKNDLDFLLGALGRLWLAGVEPDWDAFYGDEKRRRIALPTSPFERQRHWVDPPADSGHGKKAQSASADKKLPLPQWFYLPSWQRALPPASAWSEQKANWWLFVPETHGQGGLSARLARRLAEAGQQVVTVSPGTHLAQLGERHWSINPRDASDFASLLQQLKAQGLEPDRILHLWSAVPDSTSGSRGASSFDPAQDHGFHSLLFLAQALGRQEAKPVSLAVVTHRMQALGDELPSPEKATVLGPVRVIPQEFPHIACRSVDVSLPSPGSWQEAQLVEQLLAECADGSRRENVIAWRGQQRQVQVFEPISARAPDQVPLRDKGVYLVLGGFGTIGFNHAEALAKRVQARLVLVGRSALPERSAWDSWLATHDEKDPIGQRIRKVRALEALGAEVLVASADVADAAQLRTVVDQALSRFGALHGVVFSAGTVDASLFRSLADVTPTDARFLFQSRALGLYALEEALRGRQLDFCMLASSLAAVLGGVGRASYSAAMSFMDAFALRQTQESPTPWLSVGWDAWASDSGPNPFGSLSISATEGAEAFAHLLSLGPVAQVAVSTSHLPARIERNSQPEPQQKAEVAKAEHVVPDAQSQQAAPRPALQNAYVAPRDELEEAVAKLWESMLGITQVGIHDNFFELGGNSLVGIKLIARVREQFGVPVPAVTLYEGPTVEALAKLLKAASGGAEEPSDDSESRSRGERRRAKRQRRGDSTSDEEN
ncbi:type I polyketide synthase [Vitiosangium sp. GDMCC 1.1324]|uniref:type I polyketide synthase n=1 Tax=Vitiosangium sp. (strain GDMCC 1.1324) TaxID=2138576 RepID=UPI000D3CCAE9|nr:type I polyketide synthase [Vitiosangium sp. GDMCC 1.1324]PTL75146.1 polyketide synthase [Vitiosangium sp. GDMCC 1.1324]